MAFQIKDFASITASMVNWVRSVQNRLTDFSIGSINRTLIEAPAIEIDELYQQIFNGLKEAIPVSVYLTFGFPKLPALAASGLARFTTPDGAPATELVVIPVGAEVRAPAVGISFLSLATANINVGQTYVDVLVACTVAGTIGNVGAGAINQLGTQITGVGSVTNPADFRNGRDVETDDDRLIRFREYISTLARGTNTAIIFGAKTAFISNDQGVVIERVASASTYEPYVDDPTQPIAYVECYVHNGASATSPQLVAQAQKIIDGYVDESDNYIPGWKAAGVVCEVIAATEVPIDVTGVITVETNVDKAGVLVAAADSIRNYLQTLDVGATVIHSELIAIVKRDVPGVFNVVLSAPTGDEAIARNEKAIPGTVTLT